jgi:hypothetical protein
MQNQDEEFGELERDESAPLDMLAALYEARGWNHEFASDEELTAEYKGSWTSYQIRAIWREEDNALQLLVFPDVTAPSDKHETIYKASSPQRPVGGRSGADDHRCGA